MGKAAKVLRHLLKEGVRATAGKPGKRDGLKNRIEIGWFCGQHTAHVMKDP
jgi:hypothetical protein